MKFQKDSEKSSEQQQHILSLIKIFALLKKSKEVGLKWRMSLAFIFLILAKLVNICVPFFYKYAVDALSQEASVIVIPTFLIVAYGLARVLTNVFAELRDFVFVHVNQFLQREVALQTFTHLHKLSLKFHLQRQTGGISRIIERGVHGLQFVLTFLIFNILPTLLEIALVSGVLFWNFPPFFAGVVLLTIFSYISFTLFATEWRLKFRRLMNEKDNEANTKAIDSLLNYETVKYFGNEEHEMNRFDESLQVYRKAAIQNQQTLSLLNVGQGLIIGLGLIVLMWRAAYEVTHQNMTIGDFVMVNSYLIQLYMPLGFLGFVYREIKRGLVSIDDLFRLLEVEQTIKDPIQPVSVKSGQAWNVQFRDVSFSYDGEREILKNVSFNIQQGQTLAIVGASGSGKSTIARLLFRFFDVDSGEISVGNINVKDFKQSDLRAFFGVVPQDTVLFNNTIEYNIRYGNLKASKEEWRKAAKLAEIDDFIMSLPKQYQSEVGERGLKLSGGEKQRVSIARSVLKNPHIYIFDEASSALDSQTEQHIQKSLKKVSQGKTTLIIAHRLSTIMDADQIIVLNQGEVVESGTHEALLENKKHYAHMWSAQEKGL